jgi:hypothetical protein
MGGARTCTPGPNLMLLLQVLLLLLHLQVQLLQLSLVRLVLLAAQQRVPLSPLRERQRRLRLQVPQPPNLGLLLLRLQHLCHLGRGAGRTHVSATHTISPGRRDVKAAYVVQLGTLKPMVLLGLFAPVRERLCGHQRRFVRLVLGLGVGLVLDKVLLEALLQRRMVRFWRCRLLRLLRLWVRQ